MARRPAKRQADFPAGATNAFWPAPSALEVKPLPVLTPVLIVGTLLIWAATLVTFERCLFLGAQFDKPDQDEATPGWISWDDPDYVRDNKMLHDESGKPDWYGLSQIWNPKPEDPRYDKSVYKHEQYYPLVFTTFWIEYFFTHPPLKAGAGDAFKGQISYAVYHRTNVALHLLNIALVVWLIRRLGLSQWVALAVAGVFALHPTQVASIAWMSERKNTLSAFFYLSAFILYLRHRRAAAENPAASKTGRLLLFQFGAYFLAACFWFGLALNKTEWPQAVLVVLALVTLVMPCALMLSYGGRMKGWGAYAGSMACLQAALFSKTQTLTLFLSLLLVDMLLQSLGRLPRLYAPRPVGRGGAVASGSALFSKNLLRVVVRVLPMLAAGVIIATVTARTEHQNGPSSTPDWPVWQPHKQPVISLPAQRWLAIAPTAGWFYVSKFLAPVWLAPVYPRWHIPMLFDAAGVNTTKDLQWYHGIPTDPKWYLGLAAWPVALTLVVLFRRRLGGYVLWGMANFVILLSPALGLAPFNYQQYSFVADHFLYLPNICGGLVLAVLFERLALWSAGRSATTPAGGPRVTVAPGEIKSRIEDSVAPLGAAPRVSPRLIAVSVFCVALLLACAVKSHDETRYWVNLVAFWKRAIAGNDECYPGNLNLGNHYMRNNRPQDSLPLYKRICELHPQSADFVKYISALSRCVGPLGTEKILAACTERIADMSKYQPNPAIFLAYFSRAEAYTQLGRIAEACADYASVIQTTPPRVSNAPEYAREAASRRTRLGCPTPPPNETNP